jgi:hypothetical protein
MSWESHLRGTGFVKHDLKSGQRWAERMSSTLILQGANFEGYTLIPFHDRCEEVMTHARC